ncbi:MAG: DUF6569 family protein [Gaiellales bacterium]
MSIHPGPSRSLPFSPGDPATFGGLALIPLFPAVAPVLDYLGLDEALTRGLLITEVDHAGSVSTLAVSNVLDVNVLLFEGEELVGAKQNRILDHSILVCAQSRTPVPVSCVERGRWSYRSQSFASAPRTAYPELRRAKREGGDQSHVWSEVAAKARRLDASSPTEASEEMYVSRRASLDDYVDRLPRLDGQCGSIVCVAGRVVCLDYVGRPDVYAGLHAKLLQGYALDAIEQPMDAPLPGAYVASLLRRIARATRTPSSALGLGLDCRLETNRLVGSELLVDGETVALSVFPRAAA